MFQLAIPEIPKSDDKSDTPEPLETRTFEFVTITTQPSTMSQSGTSKQVRTQAMRDYLRKQNKEAITGIPEVLSAVALEEPSQYKGRFKLNTWTHKAKRKSPNARKQKSRDVEIEVASEALVTQGAKGRMKDESWQAINAGRLPNSVFSVNGRLDPFNTLAVQLGPHSEKILTHCQSPELTSGFPRSQSPLATMLLSPLPWLQFLVVVADNSRRFRYDHLHHEFCSR